MSNTCCKQNNSQTAGIGCFGVIIIGLMIFFVGRWSTAPLAEDVQALRTEVSALKSQMTDVQTAINEARLETRAMLMME